jgi:3-oxoacyl-[acyl-carrier-protein] synthase II
MLVLAKLSIAHAAGAPILAEVAGYGLSADGYHPTAPQPGGEGAARAIAAALAEGGLDGAVVNYINGHGTGTRRNDSAESNAVRQALGPRAGNVPLSSVKSMIGHLLGAAGAVEAIATVLALRDQVAPPTAGFAEPDPDCGLDPIPGTGRRMPIDVALSNNFAFGGANATIAFTRPGKAAAPPARRLDDEVVITGVGVVSPAAASRSELWRSYTEGTDSWRWEHGLRVSRVNLDPAAFVSARQGRRLDRLSLYAIAASRRALDDAKLDIGTHNGDRTGVIFGTGLGPVESLETFSIPVLDNGPGAANPAVFPNTVYNAAAGHIAMLLGTRGPTSTVTVAHAAGAAAVCVAEDMLRADRTDALLCVAADALSPVALQVYAAIPLFRSQAAQLCLLAEGAIAIVLEHSSAARARGARILGGLSGHAITSDAAGIAQWDSRGTGIERAMRTALDRAALSAADLSAIWANTTGLPAVDQPEHAALARLQGTVGITIHKPKLVLGEPIGVSALQSAALAIQAWDHGGDSKPVLINSSSLGGTHISLILSSKGKRPR